MKMNILTAFYHISYEYLKEYLDYKPKLILTNAKGYYGKIYFKHGKAVKIALSKFHLYIRPQWIEKEDIEEIIDTICHEFAHMYYRKHNKKHQNLTNSFKTMVICKLKLNKIDNQLSA